MSSSSSAVASSRHDFFPLEDGLDGAEERKINNKREWEKHDKKKKVRKKGNEAEKAKCVIRISYSSPAP